MKLITFLLALGILVLLVAFVFGQSEFANEISLESRFFMVSDVNENFTSLSSVGLSFYHPFKELDNNRKMRLGIMVPVQFITNNRPIEERIGAYAIGALLKLDICTSKECKNWQFTLAGGYEYLYTQHNFLTLGRNAILTQIGFRYANPDALLKNVEFGVTSSLSIFRSDNVQLPILSGLYARIGLNQLWER